MAFRKFVRDLLKIKPDEDDTDGEKPKTTADPAATEEPKPEPSRAFLWFLLFLLIFGNIFVFVYFGFATHFFIVREETICLDTTIQNELTNYCGIQFCSGYGLLAVLLLLVYIGLLYFLILKPLIGRRVHRAVLKPADEWWMKISRTWVVTIILLIIVMAFFIGVITYESLDHPAKVTGVVAPIFFIAAGWLFSTNRSMIKWRSVVTGIFCQFALAIFCLRLSFGRDIFQCIGLKVDSFLRFTGEGSRFVFGPDLVNNWVFAFTVLPVIFFFSFCVSILYYLGTMQWIILKLGWLLQQILGSTTCESVVATGNIFLGMVEAPLMIRPYLNLLTTSEMHAVMASGFATVAGSVLLAYISFGANACHLITSCVMAAPGVLAFSKLYMPETEESQTTSENIELRKSEDDSLLGAASSGASIAIPIVLGIIANIVAFLAFIAFLNAVVHWLFLMINVEAVDFVWIFSRLFVPVAWALGVPWDDCDIVSQILAYKSIVNEFVAFQKLGEYTKNEDISARSSGIATFAICGFANPGSLGILIGALVVMTPTSKPQIVAVALRAFIVGSIVCYVSASFAGILMNEETERALYKKFFDSQKKPSENITETTTAAPPAERFFF